MKELTGAQRLLKSVPPYQNPSSTVLSVTSALVLPHRRTPSLSHLPSHAPQMTDWMHLQSIPAASQTPYINSLCPVFRCLATETIIVPLLLWATSLFTHLCFGSLWTFQLCACQPFGRYFSPWNLSLCVCYSELHGSSISVYLFYSPCSNPQQQFKSNPIPVNLATLMGIITVE